MACLHNRRLMWSNRLAEQEKASDKTDFVTLTYDDEHLTWSTDMLKTCDVKFPIVVKKDVQDFIKRVRKAIYGNGAGTLRYFLCSEYGPTTLRPHYHLLLFNCVVDGDIVEFLSRYWDKGFISAAPVSEARISYTAKYTCDTAVLPEYITRKYVIVKSPLGYRHDVCKAIFKPFMLCSKGIGLSMLENADKYDYYQKHYSYVRQGIHYSMPRYYRDKLYTTDEKKEEVRTYLLEQQQKSDEKLAKVLRNELAAFDTYEEWKDYRNRVKCEHLKRLILKKAKL